MRSIRKSLPVIVVLVLSILFAACSSGKTREGAQGGSSKENYAGVFSGSAPGYHGDIEVELSLDQQGRILDLTVGPHDETPGIGDLPLERMPQQIIASQSLAVDGLSGATVTGDALLKAVSLALAAAGLDPEDYDYRPVKSPAQESFRLDLAALPEKTAKTGSLVLTDVRKRKVTIGLPVSTYAVSTMDMIDFIVPLLGEEAFHRLVGSGQDGGGGLGTYARLYTPVVGNYMQHVGQISDHNAPFDLEMILAVNPDVLLVNSAMGAHRYALEIEAALTRAGIPIVLVDVPGKNFSRSSQDTLRLLGKIFQKEARAEEVATFIDDQFRRVASKNLGDKKDKPRFYYEKSGYSEIFGTTSSSASGWGTVIALAGGENIADPILAESFAGKQGNNTLDPEYILDADPDFIILSGSGAGWMDNYPGSSPRNPRFDILNRTGWNTLHAVKNKNVYELAHACSRSIFGFHSVQLLAKIFYPDDFRDLDAEAIMDEFFQRFMLVDSDVTGWIYRAEEVSP